MRLPRPRFKVRSLSLAVAMSAAMLGVFVWVERRSRHFNDLARAHLLKSRLPDQARAEFHQAMREKYLHAAGHPWLSVEDDPAEPAEPPGRRGRP